MHRIQRRHNRAGQGSPGGAPQNEEQQHDVERMCHNADGMMSARIRGHVGRVVVVDERAIESREVESNVPTKSINDKTRGERIRPGAEGLSARSEAGLDLGTML
jgi:hypothetical protein